MSWICRNGGYETAAIPVMMPWGWLDHGGMDQKVRKDTLAIDKRVRDAGLRPTRQRVALAHLLFAKGDRHLSAEELHEEALAVGVPVSLATVYNALHQFTDAGLLRILAVEGAKTYFDTNTSNHYHFFCERTGRLLDIETGGIRIEGLPEAPEGMAISRVDVLVRLVRKNGN